MGDKRFRTHYERVKGSDDPSRELRAMADDELVQALAGASADQASQYFVNVLASEALNRIRRSRLVEQHIADGVCTLDDAGRIAGANPAAQRMLGWSDHELRGRRLSDLCERTAGADTAHVCAFMRVYEDGRAVGESTERFLTADGGALDVAYTAVPVHDDGATIGVVVAFRDVGKALAARTRLLESEGRYRALFENSADLIVSVDLDSRIAALNPAGERLTGYLAGNVRGLRVIPFLHAADQARAGAMLERVFEGASERAELRVIDATGATRVFDVSGVPIIAGGRVVGAHAVARDVTSARHAEEELRSSELRHRAAADGLRDEAVIVLSPDGIITTWSRGAADLLGWTSEQVRGAPYAVLFPPEAIESGAPARQLARAAAEGVALLDEPRMRADGGVCFARGAMRRFEDAGGRLAGHVVVLRRHDAWYAGVLILARGRIQAACETAAQILERTPSELVGARLAEVDDVLAAQVDAALASGGHARRIAARARAGSGRELHLELDLHRVESEADEEAVLVVRRMVREA